MNTVPDNFPTYTSYSPKTLLMHVDILKSCIRELQEEVTRLKNNAAPQVSEPKVKKEPKNG
jgi:hypothetical protein